LPFKWFSKRKSSEEATEKPRHLVRSPVEGELFKPSSLVAEHLSGPLKGLVEVEPFVANGARVALLCKLFGVKLVPRDEYALSGAVKALNAIGIDVASLEDAGNKMVGVQNWSAKTYLYFGGGDRIYNIDASPLFGNQKEALAYRAFVSDLRTAFADAGALGYLEALQALERTPRGDKAFLLSTLNVFSRALDLSFEEGKPAVYALKSGGGLEKLEVGDKGYPLFDGFVKAAVEDPELKVFSERVEAEIRRVAKERGVDEEVALAVWDAVKDKVKNVTPAWLHFYRPPSPKTSEEILKAELEAVGLGDVIKTGGKPAPSLHTAVAEAVVDLAELYNEIEKEASKNIDMLTEKAYKTREVVEVLLKMSPNVPKELADRVAKLFTEWKNVSRDALHNEVESLCKELRKLGKTATATKLNEWVETVSQIKLIEEKRVMFLEDDVKRFAVSRLPVLIFKIGERMGTGFRLEDVIRAIAPKPNMVKGLLEILQEHGAFVHPEFVAKGIVIWPSLHALMRDDVLAWHTAYALFFALGIPITYIHRSGLRVPTVMNVKQMLSDVSVLNDEIRLDVPHIGIRKEISVAREFFSVFDQVVKAYLDVAKQSGTLSTDSRGLYQGLLYIFSDAEIAGARKPFTSVLTDLRGAVESIFTNLVYAKFRVAEATESVQRFVEEARMKGQTPRELSKDVAKSVAEALVDLDALLKSVEDAKKRIIEVARIPNPQYIEALSTRSEAIYRVALDVLENGWDGSEEATKKLPIVASLAKKLESQSDLLKPPKLETSVPNLEDHPASALERIMYLLHVATVISKAYEEEEKRRREEERKKKEEERKQQQPITPPTPPTPKEGEQRASEQAGGGTGQGTTAPQPSGDTAKTTPQPKSDETGGRQR